MIGLPEKPGFPQTTAHSVNGAVHYLAMDGASRALSDPHIRRHKLLSQSATRLRATNMVTGTESCEEIHRTLR